MGSLPSRSTPSMTSYMQGMKIKDKSEKGLLVRIGTLIDAVQNVQRGHANAAAGLDRRSIAINGKRPPKVVATTENVFNGASVTIDPIQTAAGLSSYEIQIDLDPNFSDPETKVAFNKNIIFKGLARGETYNLRARGITKNGQAGPWTVLDPVTTTPSTEETTADFDGYLENEGRASKTFNFIYQNERIFTMANFGLQEYADGGFTGGEGGSETWTQATCSSSLSDDVVSPYFGTPFHMRILLTPGLTEDTSGVNYALTYGEVIRYWPIMMFPAFDVTTFLERVDPYALNLQQPYPVPYDSILTVTTTQSPEADPPVTWIKFGAFS